MSANYLSAEQLAKLFAHRIYRDTEEDFHSKRMDEALYAAVFRIVPRHTCRCAF